MTEDDGQMSWVGPQAVIGMPAEIDVTNAHRIHRELVAAVSNGMSVLVIDMSETTFCDSTGVRAIVTAHKHAATTGTQLRLVATAVRRVLTLSGVDGLIPVYPSLEAALAGSSAVKDESGCLR